LLLVGLGGGERQSVGFDDRALAMTDLDAPQLLRAASRPLPQQTPDVVHAVAMIGQKPRQVRVLRFVGGSRQHCTGRRNQSYGGNQCCQDES
jgi:hypothetical protein